MENEEKLRSLEGKPKVDFEDAIKLDLTVIAEIKTQSPFSSWVSPHPFEKLLDAAVEVGDIISVHTDPRWGGSFELLTEIKKAVGKKPVMAKGLHNTDALVRRAFNAGADFVLSVGRAPSVYPAKCFVEPYSLDQLGIFPENTLLVWNSRDVRNNGIPKTETFEQARKLWPGFLCQASFIRSIDDVKRGADAVLVGTHLLEFAESLKSRARAAIARQQK